MKKTKPPLLTAKDLSNIRVIFLNECLPLNRQQEKKIKALEKRVKELERELAKSEPILGGGYSNGNGNYI